MSDGRLPASLPRLGPQRRPVRGHDRHGVRASAPHGHDRPSLGTVLPNPGGPGNPAIAEAATWSELLGPLRKRRDVLLIDPRGTGESRALACPSLAAQDITTIDLQGIATTCGGDLGARAGYYGPAAIADDFAAIRSELGIEKVWTSGDNLGART